MNYNKDFDEAIYQANFTVTENDGGGNVVLQVRSENGTRLDITSILVRMSNTAASRSVYVDIKDSDDNEINRFAIGLSLDNNTFVVPHSGNYNYNNKSSAQNINLVNGDKLVITAYSMADTEFFRVLIRGRIRGRLPTTSTAGSSNTPSLTTNYARIV